MSAQAQPGAGIGEELREERLNQQLVDAFTKKQAGQYFEALQSYTAVLEDEFLQDAKIDKHIFMRYNAQKNCGEVYEKMENFLLAKYHYTQALKIRQDDSFIWTRLGYIEFERFNDLKMAQSCFDAAAKTLNTLEKRGMKMCPILVKLAEINFLLYDFKASEVMVDALIQRSMPEQTSLVFAYLMKAYFFQLKNEPVMAQECQNRAQSLQTDAKIEDLSVIKTLHERRVASRLSVDSETLAAARQKMQIKLSLSPDKASSSLDQSFPEFFAHFISQFGSSLRARINEMADQKNLQSLTLDCCEYLEFLRQSRAQMVENWDCAFERMMKRDGGDLEAQNSTSMQVDEQAASDPSHNTAKDSHPTAQRQKAAGAHRGTRRKIDNDDLLMRKLKLEAFDNYKESVLFRDDFQVITSQSEIKAIQTLFQRRSNLSASDKLGEEEQDARSVQTDSHRYAMSQVPPVSLLDKFASILEHAQGKNVFYVARNLLRFVIDGEGFGFLRETLAFDYFQLYTLVVQASGPCSKALSGLHLLDQFGSYNVVLVMFELALFNKDVIMRTKSGPVITHRGSIFAYLNQFIDLPQSAQSANANSSPDVAAVRETYADYRLREQLANTFKNDRESQIKAFEQFKVRLLYAMMFYSFEIQNDMPLSVTIYQMLDLDKLHEIGPVHQPWLSEGSVLDFQKISTFGNCKIQEAQKVRDFDQAVNALKLAEVQQMKKGGAQATSNDKNKYRPECITYAKFYLEQLFNYLILALSSESHSSGATSLNVSFTSNEEKIKEMWEKLCYSLSRSETSEMLAIVNYIFCTLTAFQILHKPCYDSFILKRLDFDKLFQSIRERFSMILGEVWPLQPFSGKNTDKVRCKLESILDRRDVDQFLIKMEVHLLRLFTPEFLHTNVRQHGDSENQMLLAYYKSVFCLEMIRGCLTVDQAQAFKPACNFMRSLDQLAKTNSEFFVRPYLRLTQFAYPYLLSLFVDQAEHLKKKHSWTELKRLLDGSLGDFIEASLGYFLNLRVNFENVFPAFGRDQRQTRSSNGRYHNDDDEMNNDSQSEPDFEFLRGQPFSSNSAAGGVHNNLSGASQFQGMMTQNGRPDVQMLADVIRCINFCLDGRVLAHAALKVSDIKSLLRITESIGNMIFSHRNWLQDRCPTNKDRCSVIKTTFREVNPQSINFQQLCRTSEDCLCVQQGKKQESCFEPGFASALSLVIFFLLNVFTQVGLPTSSAILPNLELGQRTQFLEKLASLSELKKLRALIYIDLQYSEHLDITSLMMSYVFLQYYKTSNEAKVNKSYQDLNEYKDMKQFHKQASNCVITTLIFILKDGSGERSVWRNITNAQLMKIAMEQLLQVQLTRIRGKEYVKYMQTPLQTPTLQTYLMPFVYLPNTEKNVSAIKLRLLRDEASVYAYICAQLDMLSAPMIQSADPRSRQLPREKLALAANQVIQILLEEIQQTQQLLIQHNANRDKPIQNTKQKQILLSDKHAVVCRSRIQSVVGDAELTQALKVMPQASLTYDYYYLQANLQQEDELQISAESLALYLRALEIAIASNNQSGVFQIMLKIIEMSLLIASQLKYGKGPGMTDETSMRYLQMLETVSKQVLYDISLKKMMDSFLAITMQSIHEGQDHANRTVIEFQFDNESIIYDRFASSTIRPRILKKQSFAEINMVEKTLTKLYETGDKLVYMLSKSFQKSQQQGVSASAPSSAHDTKGKTMPRQQDFQKEWLKVEYNQVLAKSLFFEFQASIELRIQAILAQNQRPRMNQWNEGWNLIREMQLQILKDLQNINDILTIQIQNYQQQWGMDLALCLMGVIKSSPVSSKHILNLQTVQSALTQFFTVEKETRLQQDSNDRCVLVTDDKRSNKSLVCFTNFNVFTAGVIRAKVKLLLLSVCEKNEDYEPARDIFKTSMTKVKQNLNQNNECKYAEISAVFELSKQTYLKLITEHANSIYSQYANLAYQLRENTSPSAHPKIYHAYVELRQKYHTSSEVIPHILKDIFEIFVDTHNSKMFLRKMELLTGEQQLQLRKSVLKVCAVCGPDQEQSSSGQITSKFINLAKLEDKDYLYEGLRICISWFEKVLEGTANSHNIGTNQAFTGKLTARGSKSASDLRRKLLETQEEMERRIDGGVAAPQDPQRQAQNGSSKGVPGAGGSMAASKEAYQAQQVFKQGGGFGTMAPQRK